MARAVLIDPYRRRVIDAKIADMADVRALIGATGEPDDIARLTDGSDAVLYGLNPEEAEELFHKDPALSFCFDAEHASPFMGRAMWVGRRQENGSFEDFKWSASVIRVGTMWARRLTSEEVASLVTAHIEGGGSVADLPRISRVLH